MADNKVYRASTTAPVNIAVVKSVCDSSNLPGRSFLFLPPSSLSPLLACPIALIVLISC